MDQWPTAEVEVELYITEGTVQNGVHAFLFVKKMVQK